MTSVVCVRGDEVVAERNRRCPMSRDVVPYVQAGVRLLGGPALDACRSLVSFELGSRDAVSGATSVVIGLPWLCRYCCARHGRGQRLGTRGRPAGSCLRRLLERIEPLLERGHTAFERINRARPRRDPRGGLSSPWIAPSIIRRGRSTSCRSASSPLSVSCEMTSPSSLVFFRVATPGTIARSVACLISIHAATATRVGRLRFMRFG